MKPILKATRKTEEVKPTAESLFDEEPEVVTEQPKSAPKAKAVKKKKEFGQSDVIVCRSITQGGLYVEGPKSKHPYAFSNYGDTCEIEYRDLVALAHTRSSYIFHPYFIIDDADFVAEFPQVEKFYAEYYDLQDLEAVLDYPVDQMMDRVRNLPKGAADNLKMIASSRVADGRLDSVRKIRELNEFFGIDLNLVAELSQN